MVVAAGMLITACVPAAPPESPDSLAGQDAGAGARTAALTRYDITGDGSDRQGHTPVTTTPDIVGMSPEAAATKLAAAGLTLRLTADHEVDQITGQSPAAGQPLPVDGVIEGRLGEPGERFAAVDTAPSNHLSPHTGSSDTRSRRALRRRGTIRVPLTAVRRPQAVPAPSSTPDQPAPPAPRSTPTATPETSPATDITRPGYVLPPATGGGQRINPRQLPAVPFGTELTGDASWYGPGFDGRRTACGGIYDQDAATIASRELRCGTVVRVTGPTGLTVEATVTDWGPTEWSGRRFDLSPAVFNAIAPLEAGVVPVRVVTANVPD